MNRTIFHIDANSAYLSWEAVKRIKAGSTLDLRTIPSVIGGDEKLRHGIVLAKSISAAKYGIFTGESLFSARKKCPDVLIVPPDFETYSLYSNSMAEILSQYSPVLQRFSVDECFLDYTGMEMLFGNAKKCADEIRNRIFHELGFTVNIGIGPNKLLAKMAGDLKKPNMTHTIFKDEIQQKMWQLPVSDLYMVGRSTASVLNRYGINTIGQLAVTPIRLLVSLFGKNAYTLLNYANGVDYSPVCDTSCIPPKSISNSTTLPYDLSDKKQILKVMLSLCESVATRMRKGGFECSLVSVSVRSSDFNSWSCQSVIQKYTSLTQDIYDEAVLLFDKGWDKKSSVRQIGVCLGHLSSDSTSQLSVFDNKKREQLKRVDKSVDLLRGRYGYGCIMRASTISPIFPEHILKYNSADRAVLTCNL